MVRPLTRTKGALITGAELLVLAVSVAGAVYLLVDNRSLTKENARLENRLEQTEELKQELADANSVVDSLRSELAYLTSLRPQQENWLSGNWDITTYTYQTLHEPFLKLELSYEIRISEIDLSGIGEKTRERPLNRPEYVIPRERRSVVEVTGDYHPFGATMKWLERDFRDRRSTSSLTLMHVNADMFVGLLESSVGNAAALVFGRRMSGS